MTLRALFAYFYLLSQTFKEQETDYRVIREKAASQKRDVERALTRFIAKTGDTQTLFPGDSNLFPCKYLLLYQATI